MGFRPDFVFPELQPGPEPKPVSIAKDGWKLRTLWIRRNLLRLFGLARTENEND